MPDPMEAIENTLVEGKILWLAQTILEGVFSGKHGEWIHQVGLGERVKKLKLEIERVETVVAAVKGRATGNKPLARTLAHLRELMYDADDLVDDLDYLRLQDQVEGGTIAFANESAGTDGDEAEQVEGSTDNPDIRTSKRRKNRSMYWDHFTEIRVDGKIVEAECKYCPRPDGLIKYDGTNGLRKHFESSKCERNRQVDDQPQNPTASPSDAAPDDTTNTTRVSVSRKKMRVDQASACNMAAIIPPRNNTEISKRIDQITSQLQSCLGDVREFLKDSVASTYVHQSNPSDTRLRTSGLVPRKVYGRDTEKDSIIMTITAVESDVITVLPVVGVAGVGKTTLAQLVYNDRNLESQFERMWIWVSENFDKVILTREMLGSLSQENHNKGSPGKMDRQAGIQGYESYDKLQRMLQRYMESQVKKVSAYFG